MGLGLEIQQFEAVGFCVEKIKSEVASCWKVRCIVQIHFWFLSKFNGQWLAPAEFGFVRLEVGNTCGLYSLIILRYSIFSSLVM